MVDRVLFPTDGSAGANETLEHAVALAADHDASIHLLTVEESSLEGNDVLARAEDQVRNRDVTHETVLRRGEPYKEILAYAEAADVDLIVMPTHGRSGLERLLLGSVTARVMRLAEPPVLTVCPDADRRYPYRRVLVPTDGSRCAEVAAKVAVRIAGVADSAVTALSVVETTRSDANVRSSIGRDHIEDRAQRAVESVGSRARAKGIDDVSTAVEPARSVPEAIDTYVGANAIDLVVVGTHGRTGLDRYLFGGVTEKLVRTSSVPVLTVREPEIDD